MLATAAVSSSPAIGNGGNGRNADNAGIMDKNTTTTTTTVTRIDDINVDNIHTIDIDSLLQGVSTIDYHIDYNNLVTLISLRANATTTTIF